MRLKQCNFALEKLEIRRDRIVVVEDKKESVMLEQTHVKMRTMHWSTGTDRALISPFACEKIVELENIWTIRDKCSRER